jgi:dipeptidase E
LIGASAGAIMLTPTIRIATLVDTNEVGIDDLKGFEYVGFEFHPHLEEISTELEKIDAYSKETPYIVYGCKDGSGIKYVGEKIQIFGDVSEMRI